MGGGKFLLNFCIVRFYLPIDDEKQVSTFVEPAFVRMMKGPTFD